MEKGQWNAIRDLADPLFSEGKSINAVASQLEISWYDASKLKRDFDSRFQPVSEPQTVKDEPEPQGDEEATPDSWELTIQVPANRVDDILSALTLQEKMDSIRHVLQMRMDNALTPEVV